MFHFMLSNVAALLAPEYIEKGDRYITVVAIHRQRFLNLPFVAAPMFQCLECNCDNHHRNDNGTNYDCQMYRFHMITNLCSILSPRKHR